MIIERAKISDSKQLTALTIRSKSYWNYGEKQIELWLEDLTISENYISSKHVYTLTNNNVIIGYYSYFKMSKTDVKLENLFIHPNWIGKGYGKLLMSDFFERLENTTVKAVVLDADPNAKPFYSKLGFKVIGQLQTSIPNRFLPIMAKQINTFYTNI